MKTAEEFVKEISVSEELQKAAQEIKDKASLEAFLKANGCSATADEFLKFIAAKVEGEISDENAAKVSGAGEDWVEEAQRAFDNGDYYDFMNYFIHNNPHY